MGCGNHRRICEGLRIFSQNLRGTLSAFRPLMLFAAGKRILQTLREKKSNRKLIGISHLLGLTHHNIFGLSNGQCQLLGQAEKSAAFSSLPVPH
jgi:hypothetical protein